MSTLIVPPLDEEPWPTLGPQVCDFLEEFSVYGPGPLKGERYVVEPEFRAQLYRAYEVFGKDHHLAGRRRFKRVGISMRKGTAKSEKGAQVAFVESHPEGPVRCDGWRKSGGQWVPVGAPVSSPYIPMVAFTLEQSEDTAYGALKSILAECDLSDDYDVGEDRILLLDGAGREAGRIQPLATSPNARDGARTTFQFFDETHRMYLPRLKKAYSTMVENTSKIPLSDAWSLEMTTGFEPGEGSVAEDSYDYARKVERGQVDNPRLFFFHRQADDDAPLETPEEVRVALEQASGPYASWSGDLDYLVDRWFEPKVDQDYYRRVWLNQIRQGGSKALDRRAWDTHADVAAVIEAGELVTLGFDGARRKDSTALVATSVETGLQVVAGWWEVPDTAGDDFQIDAADVDTAIDAAMERWSVWRLYGDPPYWDEWLTAWQGRYGDKVVIKWWTNRNKAMAYAIRRYRDAIADGTARGDGDERLASHIGHAVKHYTGYHADEDDEPLFVIRKARRESPDKIDGAMAGCLSWEARCDAVSAGATKKRSGRAVFV